MTKDKDIEVGISDKLNIIQNKVGFIASMVFAVNFEECQFSKEEMTGFGWILHDIQNDIKELQEVMS